MASHSLPGAPSSSTKPADEYAKLVTIYNELDAVLEEEAARWDASVRRPKVAETKLFRAVVRVDPQHQDVGAKHFDGTSKASIETLSTCFRGRTTTPEVDARYSRALALLLNLDTQFSCLFGVLGLFSFR